MVQVLHGRATTTAAVRYGINQKMVAKWKKRSSVEDLPTGPTDPKSTSLTGEGEAIVIAFRQYTLLPRDDCLYALQATIPNLTRSSLHRCLQRQGISRLPDVDGDKPAKKTFKSYTIGYFHIDIAEVQTAEGKLHLFVAIDRTSKFVYTELHPKAGKMAAAQFLRHLIAAAPYTIHTVLTDNGIEHRQTKVKHPWTNGQVEHMNRTIKEATVKRFHYESHNELSNHLTSFVAAYNFAKRLKTLKGLTPYEFICKAWTIEPKRFRLNPIHEMPGINN